MGFYSVLFFILPLPVYLYSSLIDYSSIIYLYSSSIDYILFLSGAVSIAVIFWLYFSRQKGSNFFYLIVFFFLVYLYTTTTNLILFFLCYEFFLLPSFLVVFLLSPNRRGIISSIYFLMWTQIGSFIVFISLIVSINYLNSFYFNSGVLPSWITFLFFVGFGVKVPVWPFHYWLTKTHVEAPTYFSIYLSGFLVKTSLYGLWVFCFKSYSGLTYIFLIVSLIGIIDSSLKMWAQVDLKKLVAYGTIQEMNLILFCFCLGNLISTQFILLFILAHTLLSTIFFGLVDSVYKRFNSRSTYAVTGLLNICPQLGYILFICCLFFAGLPFTLKFIVEVYVFTQAINFNLSYSVILILVCNWIGLVFFVKNWFGVIFGSPKISKVVDVSLAEWLFFTINILLLFILSFYTIILV